MQNSHRYHRLTSVFRNRFVVPEGTFSVALFTYKNNGDGMASPTFLLRFVFVLDLISGSAAAGE
jgi:hypothetical protein